MWTAFVFSLVITGLNVLVVFMIMIKADQGFELFASLLFLVWLSFEFGLFVKVCFNKALINVMFFRLHGVNMNKFSKTFD